MSDEIVLTGVDPDRIQVRERQILGPQIIVRAGRFSVSVIGEIDVDAIIEGPRALEPGWALPLAAGEVELGLLGDRGLIADPLRHVPLAAASEICRRVIAGDVDAFRPLYADEEAPE